MNGPALRVRDLSYSYDAAGDPVVQVRRLDVAAGEQLVLTGQSGRGKSTLLHLLAGLMDPQLGDVVVAGQSMRSLTGSRRDRFRGRHIGMVFQTFHLLHGFTAVENVMAALMFSEIPKSGHRGRALELLDQLGIDRPMALAQELSVGQQQRVAVARAVACKPTVVLADEPTASLDPEHGRTAVRLLEESCREAGAALVCVTHDPSLVPMFDRHETLDALTGEAVGAGKGDA